MIKYLRIRYKFLLMASLGVIAIISMSLLAQNISEDGYKRVKNVFEDSKKVQNIQQDYIAPLFRVREITLSLVMAPNDDFREEIRVDLLPIVKKLDQSFMALDKNMNDIWENYKRLVFITDRYIKNNFEEGAFTNANYAERKQFYILILKLENIQAKQLENSHDTFEKAKDSFLEKKNLITTGALIVIILTLLFGFLIARNIVFSIESLQVGLGKFFDLLGRKIDKDEKIKIELDNIDEFGEMAKVINENVEVVRENLKKDIKLIEDATSVVNSLKKGDLERRLTEDARSNELNELKQVINEMINSLEDRIVLEINEGTKQKQLLIQQSKMASMGNMIGNIAHQWRQPLSEINAVLMNIQVRKEHDDLSDEFFEESMDECDVILKHMSNTISDFQNFFKPSKEKTKFSLEEECRNASFIIESSLKYNQINYEIDIDKDCKVIGYPREFSQAVLNILSNAKDVLIERKIENPYIKLSLREGNKFALIKIEDNGGGVKEEVMERLFEPYFTTKHAKQGTGIGLYMSKIIIEVNMHGFINVENSEDGAIFIIKLAL